MSCTLAPLSPDQTTALENQTTVVKDQTTTVKHASTSLEFLAGTVATELGKDNSVEHASPDHILTNYKSGSNSFSKSFLRRESISVPAADEEALKAKAAVIDTDKSTVSRLVREAQPFDKRSPIACRRLLPFHVQRTTTMAATVTMATTSPMPMIFKKSGWCRINASIRLSSLGEMDSSIVFVAGTLLLCPTGQLLNTDLNNPNTHTTVASSLEDSHNKSRWCFLANSLMETVDRVVQTASTSSRLGAIYLDATQGRRTNHQSISSQTPTRAGIL